MHSLGQPQSYKLAFSMTRCALLVALALITVSQSASGIRAQGVAALPVRQNPHGGMIVLPGYRFEALSGIDTRLGRLAKSGGPTVEYELGGLRGPIVHGENSPDILWTKTAVIRGIKLRAFSIKGDGFRIDNGYGNFVATNVRSQEDMADVLLTVLSYDPEIELRERGIKKPAIKKE